MESLERWQAPLKAPLSVCLWLTDCCNLRCRYCYAAPFSGKVMATERLLRLLDELSELEVFDVALAGGEPFLHPELVSVVERTLESGMQVAVLSNGLLLTAELRQRLARIVAGKSFILQISLDSADPEINDKTRGCSAMVLANLRVLAQMDIQIQLACVLTKHNINTAHRLIEEFYPKIKRFHFLNVQRTSKALANPDLLLEEGEAHDFWMRLKEYAKGFPSDLFLPSLRIMLRTCKGEDSSEECAFNARASFDCPSCSAGITHINVDCDFNVLGCDIAKEFTQMGNVLDAPFKDVWNSYQAYTVRNAPFPACYQIRGPDGHRLSDWLRPECYPQAGPAPRRNGDVDLAHRRAGARAP